MKQLLDDIKKSVENESISFLVGAGFSRNISKKFPLWGDLLKPLVEEMYPDRCAGNIKQKRVRVERILTEKTYLGVASEYVRRKGYHEAIDLYIERMVPYLERRDGNRFDLVINGEVIESEPSLECHQKLLSLDAKHIFTFNYDNTLDVLADVETSSRLLKLQIESENEKQKFKSLLEEYQGEYEKLTKGGECVIPSVPKWNDSRQTSGAIDFSIINAVIRRIGLGLREYGEDTSDFERLSQEHIKAIKKVIALNQSRADSAKEQRMGQYQLVTNAYQISLTDGCKNIYKLHGNLRTSSDAPYGFDGDRRMQYVITQEDYDAYSQRHEAFVNLMRISLLKGNFCLIGFSGDDPNFLGWIDWVKDILDDSDCHETQASRSVYYINAEDACLELSKALLLQNHYIKVVNLYELFADAQTRNERVLRFLDYLCKDKVKYEDYNDAWRRIDIDRNNPDVINAFAADIEQVYKLSDYNRIPEQFGVAHYHRCNLFARVDSIFKAAIAPELRSKLIYAAIRGELLPVNAVLTSMKVRQLSGASEDLKRRYQMLEVRNCVLDGEVIEEQGDEWLTYETCVSRLFNLQFDEADILLVNWQPQRGINQMRKFMLQSVYVREMDVESITSLINPDHFDCAQDYKYALDLLPQIRGLYMKTKKGGISVYEDLRQQRETVAKRYPSLVQFNEQIDGLLEDMSKRKSQPFGNVKEVLSFDSYNSQLVNSTKVLQILIELAIPTKSSNTILLDYEKWLAIFENLYKYYPIPCLYFSLLYGNEKDKLRRIAQLYIYSDKLREYLPKMLEMMFTALSNKSCPFHVREAIYIVIPYYMKAVQPDRWLGMFKKVYDEFDLESLGDGRMAVNDAGELIIWGVRLSSNEAFKHKVLHQTLSLGKNIKDIHNSLIIAASKNLTLDDVELCELKKLVDSATSPTHMYVLMNMSKWIGKEVVAAKLCSLEDSMYTDCVLLDASCQYAQVDSDLQSKLKHIILRSPLLWKTGIADNCLSVSHSSGFFDICDAQRYINFTDLEIKIIYKKLRESFFKIDTLTRKWHERKVWNFINDWSHILTEMQNFLRKNKLILKSETDYVSLSRSVTRLLNQGRGGNSISSLLLDDDKTGKAIAWMAVAVYQDGVRKLQHEYSLLINKLLLRDSKYLNNCFIHLGWALMSYSDDFDRKLFKPLLKNVLDVYKDYFLGDNELDWELVYAEKDIVEQELCKIYKVYKSWGGYVKFWESYVPRYYS